MLITPRPGVNLDSLIQNLQIVRSNLSNQVVGSDQAHRQMLGYLKWAGQAARVLGNQIGERDLAALVLNRRYELLLSSLGHMAGSDQGLQRLVTDLVSLEVDERNKDFDAAIAALQRCKDRWKNVGDLLVLDTNFYVEHPTELIDTDLAQLTVAKTPGSAMHLLVPLLVVDELDRLKRHGDTKTRARAALKLLDEVFKNVSEDRPMGRLREANDSIQPDGTVGLGAITMELLFDPPDHERLPDNDAEIVDRAVAIQALAGRPVTMLTYDKNMSFRARYVGLQEIWLPHP